MYAIEESIDTALVISLHLDRVCSLFVVFLEIDRVVIVACHLATVIEIDCRDHPFATQDQHGLDLVIDYLRLHAIEIGAIQNLQKLLRDLSNLTMSVNDGPEVALKF